MPRSRSFSRRRRQRPRPTPPQPVRSRRIWRKRIGWTLAIVGGILFLAGNIGARTGIVILPFDPHHVYTQFGGAAVGMIGISVATSR